METETNNAEKEPQKEEITSEKTNDDSWISEELEQAKSSTFDGEKKPALKLEENKTVEMTVDFSKPFDKWDDTENKSTKAIIPVKVGEAELVWWLNIKNPIYAKILESGKNGKTTIKVLQVGDKQTTKYVIID